MMLWASCHLTQKNQLFSCGSFDSQNLGFSRMTKTPSARQLKVFSIAIIQMEVCYFIFDLLFNIDGGRTPIIIITFFSHVFWLHRRQVDFFLRKSLIGHQSTSNQLSWKIFLLKCENLTALNGWGNLTEVVFQTIHQFWLVCIFLSSSLPTVWSVIISIFLKFTVRLICQMTIIQQLRRRVITWGSAQFLLEKTIEYGLV